MASIPSSYRPLAALVVILLAAIVAVTGVIFARELSAPRVSPTPALMLSDVTLIEPPQPMPDWTLTDTSGQPFSAAQLAGRPSVLFFGFANCPDICPMTLHEFQRVRRSLGDDAQRVNFVFISVDGNRDTPAALRQKLERLGVEGDIIGLTGDPELVREVGRPFNVDFVYSQPNESGFYTVDHTASYFLLDSEQRWVKRFAFGTNRATLIETLQTMLAQG